MHKCLLGCLTVLALCGVQTPVAAEPIRVLFEEGADAIGSYCMGLLILALSKIDHQYTIEHATGLRTSARSIENVESGELSLVWGSADAQLEQTLLPVRIPLYKGLLGHRIFIIHKDAQHRFNSVRTLDDLKQFTFAQGATWADAQVLEQNGLRVLKVHKYHSLFHMLDGGRYDAFPRGLQEPWQELTAWRELDLTVESRVMLVYRMPFYFFVGRHNPQLAADIERGLNLAIADGSFDEYFFKDPTVRDALQRSDIQNRVVIELKNPSLPSQTPVDRKELWLNADQLK